MARTRQTARSSRATQSEGGKPSKTASAHQSKGKRPRKAPNQSGVKKPRKPRGEGPAKPVVARVVTDNEIQQYNNCIFKAWKHLKENPTPKMLAKAQEAHVLKHGSRASEKVLREELGKFRMTSQYLKTINDYVVLAFLGPMVRMVHEWNPRNRKGKTFSLRRIMASLPYLHVSNKVAYEVRQQILESVSLFKESLESE